MLTYLPTYLPAKTPVITPNNTGPSISTPATKPAIIAVSPMAPTCDAMMLDTQMGMILMLLDDMSSREAAMDLGRYSCISVLCTESERGGVGG